MYGDGSIYRRGRTWWLRFWRDGKQIRMSAETCIQGEARQRLREELKNSRVPTWIEPIARKARQRFFSQDEVARLVAVAQDDEPWIHLLIDLAFRLGWRRGELLSLHVADVNFAEGTVRIKRSKNEAPRECAP